MALGFCCAPVKAVLLTATAVSALTEGSKLYGKLQKLPFQERVEKVVTIVVRDFVQSLCLNAGLKVNGKIADITKKAVKGILANNKLAQNLVNKATTAVNLLQKNPTDVVKGKIKKLAKNEFKVAKDKNLGKNVGNLPNVIDNNLVEKVKNEFVNLASKKRTNHILFGESLKQGGHMWPGNPGKTVFPKSWSAKKILHMASDIATDPSLKWITQTGNGGSFTKAGNPAKFIVEGVREGIKIRVVVEPAGEGIVTAFPILNL